MNLRIALLQLLPGDTLEKQLEIGKEACIKVKEMGADIALFPEMWSTGYDIPQDAEKLSGMAISSSSDFVQDLANWHLNLKWQSVLHISKHTIRSL